MKFTLKTFLIAGALLFAFSVPSVAQGPNGLPDTAADVAKEKSSQIDAKVKWRDLSSSDRQSILQAWRALPADQRPPFVQYRDEAIADMSEDKIDNYKDVAADRAKRQAEVEDAYRKKMQEERATLEKDMARARGESENAVEADGEDAKEAISSAKETAQSINKRSVGETISDAVETVKKDASEAMKSVVKVKDKAVEKIKDKQEKKKAEKIAEEKVQEKMQDKAEEENEPDQQASENDLQTKAKESVNKVKNFFKGLF